MRVTSPIHRMAVRRPAATLGEVNQIRREVHRLTDQTQRLADRHITSLSLTTTAGLVTTVGGGLSLIPATRTVGLALAGAGGVATVAGVGFVISTYRAHAASEAERLQAAGDLFEARRALGRQRMEEMLTG